MVRPPASSGIAAFFDLDKTVIAGSSTLAFSRPLYRRGLIDARDVVRAACGRGIYLLAGANHNRMERLRTELTALVTGWNVDTVRATVRETLQSIVAPLLYEEALDLITWHKSAGHDVVLVSSSGQDVVEPIGELLGVDTVIATRMVIRDGCYTGEIDFYAYAENKVTAMRELADRDHYDLAACYGYSDSITDLPLLRAVGHPYVVNPDRALRRAAGANGWPVLEFHRNGRGGRGQVLREAVHASRSGADLAVAALTVAGLVWAARRSRPARRSGFGWKGKDLGQGLF